MATSHGLRPKAGNSAGGSEGQAIAQLLDPDEDEEAVAALPADDELAVDELDVELAVEASEDDELVELDELSPAPTEALSDFDDVDDVLLPLRLSVL